MKKENHKSDISNWIGMSKGQGETAEMAEMAEMTALLAIIVLSMLRMIAHGSFTLS